MSRELFSDDDARILDQLVAEPVDGTALDEAELHREQPAALSVSQEVLRLSKVTGNEGLLYVKDLPPLPLDIRERLSRPILALNGLSFEDPTSASQLKSTTGALDSWGGAIYATVRTPLVLGANALRSMKKIGDKRVEILGAALTQFCGLPLLEYPSPEYAAYFCDSLDEVPAHIVRGSGEARETRPIQYTFMTQCLSEEVPLPAWAAAQAGGGMSAAEYIREYERRFMLARAIFTPYISPDEDLGYN